MFEPLFDQAKIHLFHNPAVNHNASYPKALRDIFDTASSQRAVHEISQWPDYHVTPLHSLDRLADELDLGGVYFKDESTRFGLGSFKALGGAYEVLCLLQEQISTNLAQNVTFAEIRSGQYAAHVSQITVITATDGNHGRSVAWGARLFGCPCVIYIHAAVSEGRKTAMEDLGARVVRIDGNYDDSVAAAAEAAEKNGWFIVSDTSWEGYTHLPKHVMAGYTVMADEIDVQLSNRVNLSHTFVQGGVGGLAAAMCGYQWQRYGKDRPRFVIVEPDRADCLYQSAKNGQPTEVRITEETIMAGMSCGRASELAWQVICQGAEDFMTIPDTLVSPVMRDLAAVRYGDTPIVAGESAVAGLSALIAVSRRDDLRETLALTKQSQVLLYGTEGATDPQLYRDIVGRSAEAVLGSSSILGENAS
ncbi:MAG: diaminopropionate ammonia-lyase [Desulfuromonadales bacterium]|jgi:diaminopropionate ammonia-lyase